MHTRSTFGFFDFFVDDDDEFVDATARVFPLVLVGAWLVCVRQRMCEWGASCLVL